MGPVNCNIHGVQLYITTSPRLAEAIEKKEIIDGKNITKIIVISPDLNKTFEHVVDKKFSEYITNNTINEEIILTDRDKKNKKQNDRILVQSVLKELKWVCPICLSDLLKNKL